MGNSYFINPILFIIETILGIFLLFVMLRFLLQLVRADFYNPLSQFLVKVTNPFLVPLRRVLPAVGSIDTSSVVLMFLVAGVEAVLVFLLLNQPFGPFHVFVAALLTIVRTVFYLYLIALIIQVIISWVAPNTYSPVTALIHQLTDPLLRPIRRRVPPIEGLDFSVMILMMIIVVLMMLVLPLLEALMR